MNPTDKKLYNITLALAGIFQAAIIVHDLAKTGNADEAAFTTSINSIYKIDAHDTTEIYGNAHNLQVGLQALIKLFGTDKNPNHVYISRYVISMLHLERKLIKNKTLLDVLSRRIKHAVSQANYFSNTHPTVIASLADTYVNSVGKLSFRLHVLGQAKYLNQSEVANKVRAILLAGIRSTVLWRQLGGNRLQLFFWRNKLANMAKQILNTTESLP